MNARRQMRCGMVSTLQKRPEVLWTMRYDIGFCIMLAVTFAVMPRHQVMGQSKSAIRKDGTILLNGKPHFPFGFYHVSWIDDRRGKVQLGDLKAHINKGFNLIHPNLNPSKQTSRFLDLAENNGVNVIVELHWPTKDNAIRKMKQHQAILGWNIADDFNWPAKNPKYSPRQLKGRHDAVKAIDSDHVTFGAAIGHTSVELKKFAAMHSVDIIGIESYPIGNVSDAKALQQNINYFKHAFEATKECNGVSVMTILQTFAWEDERYPNAEELRNMLYGSLVYQSKGIVGYAFYDGGKTIVEEEPGLWNELSALKKEVDQIAPALMDGKHSFLSTSDGIFAACWEHQRFLYVIALNTDRTGTKKVSLELPTGYVDLRPVFNSRPNGLTVSLGKLKGDIEPADVHVYRLTRNEAASAKKNNR